MAKRKIQNLFNPRKENIQFTEGQKSKGILDDYATRRNIDSKEGTVQHTPTADKHIVNKKFVDDALATNVTSDAQIADHKIVRGDGGDRKVQDSMPEIDDSGNMTNVAKVTLTGSGAPTADAELANKKYADDQIDADIATHAALNNVHHNKSHAHDGADGSGTVAHSDTTGQTANDHHAQSHSHASHTGIGADDHHAQTHTIVSHDTSATGIELDTLTDNSMADTLHRHSELSAPDGSHDKALQIDNGGEVGIGIAPSKPLHVFHATKDAVAYFESGDVKGGFQLFDSTTGVSKPGIFSQGDDLTFSVGGGERIRIRSAGKTGIGLTPATHLDVEGAGADHGGYAGANEVVGHFKNTTASKHSAISIDALSGQDPTIYLAENGEAMWDIRNDASATDKFHIRYQGRTGANDTRVSIKPTGEFGISAGAPNSLLTLGSDSVSPVLSIKEMAAAPTNTAAYGKLWVKTATPNQLWFTDDAGTSTQIV